MPDGVSDVYRLRIGAPSLVAEPVGSSASRPRTIRHILSTLLAASGHLLFLLALFAVTPTVTQPANPISIEVIETPAAPTQEPSPAEEPQATVAPDAPASQITPPDPPPPVEPVVEQTVSAPVAEPEPPPAPPEPVVPQAPDTPPDVADSAPIEAIPEPPKPVVPPRMRTIATHVVPRLHEAPTRTAPLPEHPLAEHPLAEHPMPQSAVAAAAAPSVSVRTIETSFRGRIRDAVQASVRCPAAARMMGLSGKAEVAFDYRDGALVGGVGLSRSSGAPMLDAAALAAVRDARYPKPPPELTSQLLRLLVWVEEACSA